MKTVLIKLTKAGPTSGPFDVFAQDDSILESGVTKKQLSEGVAYSVNDDDTIIKIVSTSNCAYTKIVPITEMIVQEYMSTEYREIRTGCIWRHLTNIQLYNSFYGETEPYIIEYPFAYKYQDELLQNVKDYTKAYTYLPNPDGVFNQNTRIETNDKYFTQAVLYNGQQSSGILNLIAKPLHNMNAYQAYPKFNSDSKDILVTKSDNFYNFNTFWALNKSAQVPLFLNSCESLSIDKVVNQDNMDYSTRSFHKAPLKAKELKVRLMLQGISDSHLVSQFVVAPSQISYK